MKKMVILILMLLTTGSKAQHDSSSKFSNDRIRRHEIGFNVIPLLNVLSGATPTSRAKFSINYRRSLNEKKMVRLSFAIFPFKDPPFDYRQFTYHMQQDTLHIYSSKSNRQSPKLQLSLGLEKVIASKRLIHSFGADINFGYQHFEFNQEYYWNKFYINPDNPSVNGQFPSEFFQQKIDTMGYKTRTESFNVGLSIFYNIRIPLSQRIGISATVGPYIDFGVATVRHEEIKTGERSNGTTFNFDGQPLFVSDLSLYLRF
jgi:hypothetical protein